MTDVRGFSPDVVPVVRCDESSQDDLGRVVGEQGQADEGQVRGVLVQHVQDGNAQSQRLQRMRIKRNCNEQTRIILTLDF